MKCNDCVLVYQQNTAFGGSPVMEMNDGVASASAGGGLSRAAYAISGIRGATLTVIEIEVCGG
jgi:hypothetical protein